MKYVGHICNKCIYKIYNGLRLPDIVIHFEYNNSYNAQIWAKFSEYFFLTFPRTSVFLVFCRRDYARETILDVY